MADWQPRNMAPISGRAPITGPDYGSYRPTYGAASSTQSWQPHSWYRPQIFRYATFWNRLGAFVLDVILDWIGYIVILVGLLIATGMASVYSPAVADVLEFIRRYLFLIPITWKVAFVASGGTPGQRALSLRITRIDGGKPGWQASLRRNCLYLLVFAFSLVAHILVNTGVVSESSDPAARWSFISIMGVMAFFVVSCLTCIGERYGRTLHDRFAGTYVIRS